MGATPSGEFMDLLGEIATQLGKFIERQQAHDQLREREEHLSQLVESVKDFAFYTLDLNGHITSWNKGAEKIKGYSRNEIIGKHFSIFYTPEDIAANKPALVLESALQEGGFNSESWRVRKDGTRFWANVIVFPIYNSAGILQGYSKLTRDLTKRKLMEEELIASQLRHEKETSELRRRLMEGREAERLGMAQELHDGPIQELYGLIFGLDAIQGKIRSQAALEQIKDMKRELQKVVSTLRGMIGDLRPPTLAPFGLEKAIRSHMQSFRDAHGEIQIEMELDVDRRTLPEDVRLALYRVYQSSMVNIVRHADASQVKVKFKLDDDQVRLEIEDNGKGFMVPERWIKLARAGHLGLVGARERVEAVGGRFIVESMPGEGTQVKVYIPREAIDVETQDGSGR
ncbi:MAG TPA: PAS domain S-box protein, partial [Anaerolineales bacterium]|nr:PAS domain S-box protein [Anaerolineales bacterium]